MNEEQPRLRAEGKRVGHRRRQLRRRHGHRPLRGRAGAGRGQRQGQRRHRHRHAGPGPFHQLCPGRGRAVGRGTWRTSSIVTGDTDHFYWGTGTFASRGAVVAGNAIHAAAEGCAPKCLHMASEELEARRRIWNWWTARSGKGVPEFGHPAGRPGERGQPLRGRSSRATSRGWRPPTTFGPERGRDGQRRPRHDRGGRSGDDAGRRSNAMWSCTTAGG